MGRTFEDLVVWQLARDTVRLIYQLTAGQRFAREFDLRNQMRRALVSVMSNIAEGFERGGDAQFRSFLVIAKGSCGELRSQLYVAFDQSYVSTEEFDEGKRRVVELSRRLQCLLERMPRQ